MRTTFKGAQHPRESADISVKPQARLCYNIYVTLSIVVYSIDRNYPGITTLKVRYYVCGKMLPHQLHISEAEEKTKWPKTQAIML